jgi:hypothetical protein
MARRRLKVRGRAWHLDRKRESKEPWEKSYKKKKRGLAYASAETKRRVARLGGKASH